MAAVRIMPRRPTFALHIEAGMRTETQLPE